MMDFLIICGINKKTVETILENPSLAYDLSVNKDECVKIILYLKILGIIDIDSLLLYKFDLFLKTKTDVVALFSSKNTKDLVDRINEDYTNIDLLFE